ncbi:DNA repair protein RecO [Parabacteroides sp. PF5-9]|uniref:DNA repair protein RecO n=1 Tax=Parabacteroides sp. PF5-9 TaxID=1742404 RepID=UPI00247664BE|nr:DNA repair protein RecO [Parabacteroides sp. PF5-9]MDH6358500.1 DNA repair protein RecO (recombination protein O) [Parabacteroides sp. PF5-9]
MLSKTRGIVLHSIPYNDKYAIIYMYTEAFGRVSYMVTQHHGKKSVVSKALFMPLSVLEMEVEHLHKRDLQRIREAKSCYPSTSLYINPIKNTVALFLAEVLFRVIKNTEADQRLFDYLYQTIHLLENENQGIANFHLVFLLGLLNHLGIHPNGDAYRPGFYFDLQNGVFAPHPPSHRHFLNPAESTFFARLLRISFENMSLYAFSRKERRVIIEHIFDYYRLHLPDFPEIKSLSVLQTIFD